jgi:hypothetical protein
MGWIWIANNTTYSPQAGTPIFFDEITPEDLPRDAALRYWELEEAGMERARIDLMIEQKGSSFISAGMPAVQIRSVRTEAPV